MLNQEEKIEILYVSSVTSEEVYKKLENILDKPMRYSIQKFHNLIIKGIAKEENVSITAVCGLPIDRNNTKKTVFKKEINENKNIKYIHIGFFNIPIIKQFNICSGMIKQFLSWYKKNKKNPNKIIICDASYVTVMPILVFISKLLKIKKVAIVADIYEYMSDKLENREKISIIKRIITRMCMYCWKNYDGFVLLTEQMSQIVNEQNKPYIVMEGLVLKETENVENLTKDNYIMYARRPSLYIWNKRFN